MPMEVVLLKSFREMIKGPALIVLLEKTSWKSERGKEFGKFQHRKDKQQYEQNLYEELFNTDFYNILEIHSKFLILYGNLVLQRELSFSVYNLSVCNSSGNIKTSTKPVIHHVHLFIPYKNNYFSEKKNKQLKWLTS